MTRKARKSVDIYARFYAKALRNPKLVGRSHLAWRLCVSSWGYCREKGNDGEVHADELVVIVPGESKRKLQAAATELVTAGLWDPDPDPTRQGWMIHDYLEHQDGSDTIAFNQERARVAADSRWAGAR